MVPNRNFHVYGDWGVLVYAIYLDFLRSLFCIGCNIILQSYSLVPVGLRIIYLLVDKGSAVTLFSFSAATLVFHANLKVAFPL